MSMLNSVEIYHSKYSASQNKISQNIEVKIK